MTRTSAANGDTELMKKLMLFSMWLAASAAAVGVAWAGVSVVDNQVVDPPSAAEVASPPTNDVGQPDEPAASDSQRTPTPVEEPSRSPTPKQVEEPTAGDQVPSSRPSPPATSAPSDTSPTPQPTTGPAPSPTFQPAPPTAPPPRPAATTPPPTPSPTAPTATTQTFTLTGGTAAISFSASGVELLWATPNPGFDVNIEPESPGIKVEFRADHHRSRVDAWWSGGPQHSIREEPRD